MASGTEKNFPALKGIGRQVFCSLLRVKLKQAPFRQFAVLLGTFLYLNPFVVSTVLNGENLTNQPDFACVSVQYSAFPYIARERG